MDQNDVQVVETATEAVSASGLTGTQKAGIIVGGVILTLGAGYGIYRLVRFLKAKKAAKKASAEEVPANNN